MAVAIPALMIAGTVAAIAGTAYTAVSASKAANYNQQVAKNNAQAASDSASFTNTLKERNLEQVLGAQRAAAGASGLSTESPSLDSVTYDTIVQGKFDQLATTYAAKTQQNAQLSQAQLYGSQGQTALTSGLVGGLGQAASGGSKYYNYTQSQSGTGLQPDYFAY